MSELIDISKMDKAEVLRVLYNDSKQQGMGFLHARGREPLTHAEAEELLKQGTSFDYLHGRVMKVNIGGNSLDPWGYDRDNGQGAAQRAISRIPVTA